MKPVQSELRANLNQSFFDLSPDLLCVVDPTGKFLQASPSYRTHLGYEPAELIGCTFHALIHPDDIGIVEDALAAIGRRRVIRGLKARGFAADGALHWFDISGRMSDDDYIYVVCRDITEQVRLSDRNQTLETQLAATLNSMTDGFFTVDRQWRITFMNPMAEITLKMPASHALGKVLWECFPDACGTAFEEHYRHAMTTGITAEFEAFFAPLLLWVEVHVYPGPDGLAVYFHDISDRVFAQDRLRLLERSIKASINGVLIVDAQQPDYPIIYANPAFERITGYSSTEVLGQNCRFLQGERTEASARAILRDAVAEGREAHVVIGNYRKDGTLFWNELYIAPVQDDSGQVTHFVGIQNDLSTPDGSRLQLAHKSHHDALTALPNQALLEDRLQQATAMSRRPGHLLALYMIELDHFRRLSDHVGVSISNDILMAISERLTSRIHATETLARIESDVFALLVPERSRPAIEALARELVGALSEPVIIRQEIYQVTASIGYTISARSDDEPAELMRRADVARREARRNGRNQALQYLDTFEEAALGRNELRRDLQDALSNDQLSPVYQPQINAMTGQVTGVEMLTRWHHPERGVVSPDQFIPLAETTGLIGPMTDWLLSRLITDMEELSARCNSTLTFGINVSPLLLRTPEFAERLTREVLAAGIAPQRIEIELTENILLDATESLIQRLNRLSDSGFRIAIDDFGTGFTGLSYLRDLPIDTLKIDQSFVRDIVLDGRDSTIVDSVVYLARHMNMTVIAEGVEFAAQARHLSRAGVHLYQGYLFSPPLVKEELVRFLSASHPRPGYVALPGPTARTESGLLVVDDDPATRNALSRLFRKEPVSLSLVGTYDEGLARLAEGDIQVLVCDLQTRSTDCVSFLSAVKARYPEVCTIVLSGTVSVSTVTEAINTGAVYRYLTKPWSDARLLEVVNQAFQSVNNPEPLTYE